MKKIFLILLIAAGVVSCDKTEAPLYAGSQTLVYFPVNTANLDVVIDDVGTANIQINASSLSDQDRTVTLEVVEGDATTVDFDNVDIPSLSVTIPAGEYFGNFVVNGIDNSVETTPELLTVRIVDAGEATISPAPVEIRVRQICPIPEGSFTGPYLLEQVTPIHPANGVLTFETQVVDVSVNGGSTERAFSAVWIEGLGIGQAPSTIPMDLSCNNVLVTSDEIGTGLACSGEPGILLGSVGQTGSYDATDDSSFSVVIGEYMQGGCGVASPLATEFNLTKQ